MINNVQTMKEVVRPQEVKNHTSKKVGVLFEFTVGKINKVDIFLFDYGRLIDTIAFQKEKMRMLGAHYIKRTLRAALLNAMEHKVEGCPANLEYIRTIVINWLCTYHSPGVIISKLPNHSAGFIFSVNDLQPDPLISASDYNSFIRVLKRIYPNINEPEEK